MTKADLTLDVVDVKNALRRVASRYPDRKNPVSVYGAYCAYTHHEDPDWHCLGGAILLELGCALPNEGAKVTTTLDRHRFTYDAADLLVQVQRLADMRPDDDPDSEPIRTYSDVLTLLENGWAEEEGEAE